MLRSFLLAAALPAFAQTPLVSELTKIAADAGGVVGVSALQVESGRRAELRGNEAFPMASAYKFPIVLALLNQAGLGNVNLASTVTIDANDIRPFHSPIAERSPKGGIKMTVGELLDHTLLESDNTAADCILGLAGGPAAITAHLAQFQVAGIRVDRSEGEIALDYAGVTDRLPPEKWTLEWFNRAMAAVPKERQARGRRAFPQGSSRHSDTERDGDAADARDERRSCFEGEHGAVAGSDDPHDAGFRPDQGITSSGNTRGASHRDRRNK